MRSIHYLITVILLVMLGACTNTREYILSEAFINEPKVISIEARRLPWVLEIERRLRESGFEVVSQSTIRQRTAKSNNETLSFNEAGTRYTIKIDGAADLSIMTRCMGGGYNFEYITVELFDAQDNKVLRQYSSNGYSEGCQPLSGTIFTDITKLIEGAWSKN
jgi:hypothetical protein